MPFENDQISLQNQSSTCPLLYSMDSIDEDENPNSIRSRSRFMLIDCKKGPLIKLVLSMHLLTGCLLSFQANADSSLLYEFVKKGHKSEENVYVSKDLIGIKAVGGDLDTDIIYKVALNRLTLINHRAHSFIVITPEKVDRIAGQLEDVSPLIRGLSEQMKTLDSTQKAKWAKMLGDFPLDTFEATRSELQSTKFQLTKITKNVSGISCLVSTMSSRTIGKLEICSASHNELGISTTDAEALNKLLQLAHSSLKKAHKVTSRFGVVLASNAMDHLTGIPIEIRSNQVNAPLAMKIKSVNTQTHAADLSIPANYHEQELKIW